MARLFVYLYGKRGFVLAGAVLAAALSARGTIAFKPNGFFDGPH